MLQQIQALFGCARCSSKGLQAAGMQAGRAGALHAAACRCDNELLRRDMACVAETSVLGCRDVALNTWGSWHCRSG
jgi:hypothetical protein